MVPPGVLGVACANARHAGTGCARCADACPVDAVDLAGGVAAIDADTCIGCGICIPACPLGAITGGDLSELTTVIGDVPPGPVAVVCGIRRTESVELAAHLVAHRACLASLGPEDLLDLAGDDERTVVLDDTACTSCVLGTSWCRLAEAAAEANKLARAYGRPAPVALASTLAAAPPPPANAWRDARGGAVTRRGLFRRLGAAVPSARNERDRLPDRRARLLDRLQSWGGPPVGDPLGVAGFSRVDIDGDRCSACGLCATFCPTSALMFLDYAEGDDRRYQVQLRPARCVGCTVCVAACQDGAVTVSPAFDGRASEREAADLLAWGSLSSCEICRSPVVSGRSRCNSCVAVVTSAGPDEAGLMADLLGRIPASQT